MANNQYPPTYIGPEERRYLSLQSPGDNEPDPYEDWPDEDEPVYPSDEYDDFTELAAGIGRTFDDYADQMERLVAKARTIQRDAECAGEVSRYEFYDRYPDITSIPSENDQYEARHSIIDALVGLLAQVAEDQARSDGYELADGTHQALLDRIQSLYREVH